MADRSSQIRELVFCHQCQNEWHRDEHGLQCPQCESEFVEVVSLVFTSLSADRSILLTRSQIERDHDPRDNHLETPEDDPPEEINPDRLPPHPLHTNNPFHNHNPWANDGADGGGVTHVEWNAGPGIHFSRTSYRSSSPSARSDPGMNDPFAPFFQSFSTILGGAGGPQRQNGNMFNPAVFHQHFQHAHPRHHGSAPTSPLQEGLPRQGFAFGDPAMPGSPHLSPRDAHNPRPNAFPGDNLQGLLGTLLRGMQEMQSGNPHGNSGGGFPPLHFFTQLLDPANARSGDAVYSEEALDRIISQFMEAQNGQSAPGPASAAAIAALPKKKADESILGPEGKAECSVCMDNVELGTEVTVLPCSHWFHEECVGAWLKEHDTCPHCRQGITAKDTRNQASSGDRLREPGEEPRTSQPPLSAPDGNQGFHFAWRAGPGPAPSSPRSPQTPQSPWGRHDSRSRRRSAPRDTRSSGDASSSNSGNSSGGFTGWVRSHFGGGSHHD